MISLAREPVWDVPNTSRLKNLHGAKVINEDRDADVTLISCGSNLHHVVAAAPASYDRIQYVLGVPAVVAWTCLIARQGIPEGYSPLDGKPFVIVEYVARPQVRYVTASASME